MIDADLDMMCLAGRIIIENGGETYRVEETVTRMGHALGLPGVEVFAIPSGIFIGVTTAEEAHLSRILRTRSRGTDLARVDEVNAISRALEQGSLRLEEAQQRLHLISGRRPHVHLLGTVIGAGLCAFGFTWMFRGGIVECTVSFLLAALAQLLESVLRHLQLDGLMTTLVRSFVTTFPAMLFFGYVLPGNTEATIGGALMPLLPGLLMTGSVQDILRGDMVSGASNLLRALLIAALIAFGALLAGSLFAWMGGGRL